MRNWIRAWGRIAPATNHSAARTRTGTHVQGWTGVPSQWRSRQLNNLARRDARHRQARYVSRDGRRNWRYHIDDTNTPYTYLVPSGTPTHPARPRPKCHRSRKPRSPAERHGVGMGGSHGGRHSASHLLIVRHPSSLAHDRCGSPATSSHHTRAYRKTRTAFTNVVQNTAKRLTEQGPAEVRQRMRIIGGGRYRTSILRRVAKNGRRPRRKQS